MNILRNNMKHESHTCDACGKVLWDKIGKKALPRITMGERDRPYFHQGNEVRNKDGSADISTEVIPLGAPRYEPSSICDDDKCILEYFRLARLERDRIWKDK